MMFQKRFSKFAPVVLRLGIAAVSLWFGFSETANPAAWTGFVPDWATSVSGLSAETIVRINGLFEIIAGTLLAFGVAVSPVAFVLFVHFLVITFDIGMTPIGVRDFGLTLAALAIALFGKDEYCFSFPRPSGREDSFETKPKSDA